MAVGLRCNPFADDPGRLARLVRESAELLNTRPSRLSLPPDRQLDAVAEVAADDLLWGAVAAALSDEERGWLRI